MWRRFDRRRSLRRWRPRASFPFVLRVQGSGRVGVLENKKGKELTVRSFDLGSGGGEGEREIRAPSFSPFRPV